jgi:3D (Asp-Asp-Asp) domain-containing protein
MTLILAASVMALLSQNAKVRACESEPASITVQYHGQTMKTSANGETAGELLSRLGLVLSGEDMVSCGLDEATYDGMVIAVDRVVTRRERTAVAIPHGIQHCADETLPEGTRQVLLEGSDGEVLRTSEVTYRNGVESRRIFLGETVTKQPVAEIVGVGTAPEKTDLPVISEGCITLPTGEVLSYTKTATVRATAYTQTDPGCDWLTATGTNVRRGIVAVDPRYIPYGTRMFIMTPSGSYIYGIAVAEDCGGDIKGDRMDLYLPTYEECREFGRRVCTVYFLG